MQCACFSPFRCSPYSIASGFLAAQAFTADHEFRPTNACDTLSRRRRNASSGMFSVRRHFSSDSRLACCTLIGVRAARRGVPFGRTLDSLMPTMSGPIELMKKQQRASAAKSHNRTLTRLSIGHRVASIVSREQRLSEPAKWGTFQLNANSKRARDERKGTFAE